MIRFYSADILDNGVLPESESAHCCRVLRLKEGDIIHVIDGKGHDCECRIVEAHSKHTRVDILGVTEEHPHWQYDITLAVAPTKNIDRMEWLVEKGVEIGVSKIVMLDCERSVRRVVKRERMEKIMISAMKQSLKSKLPELVEMQSFADFISSDSSEQKYIGYCNENIPKIDFAKAYRGDDSVSIVIGPEGDFTEKEINDAFAKGYQAVTFGNTRLRTETAALFALCAAHTIMNQNE